MKSHGAVYRKLREVKYRHLVVLYQEFLKKTPKNCHYNFLYEFVGNDKERYTVRLCMLHQKYTDSLKGVNPNILDVCSTCDCSSKCEAFVPVKNKEEIRKQFEKDLENREIRNKKYPDIAALEWVLERSVVGIPPFSWVQSIWYATKRLLLKNSLL